MITPRVVLFLVGLVSFAAAQEIPTITVKKSDGIAVSLAGITGSEAPEVTRIIANDLMLSGGITVGNTGYLAKGSAQAGSFQAELANPAGTSVFAKTYSGSNRAQAHAFAAEIVEKLLNTKGLGNSKIAFVSVTSGRKEIYTADFDGHDAKQLTHDNNISVGPSLSPDGKKLVYTGYISGYADVYSIDLNSGSRNRIIKFPGTNTGAAFSPDGGRLAVSLSKDGNPELYVVGANGGGAKRLTKTRGVESSPTWSPDGKEIIYVSDDSGSPQLYRISSGGGAPSKISTGFGYCTEPSWSPDGRKLAFTVRSGGMQIAVLDFASGNVRLVTSGGDAEDPAFGPNSRSILYVQDGALTIVDSDTGRRTRILPEIGRVSEASWSRE